MKHLSRQERLGQGPCKKNADKLVSSPMAWVCALPHSQALTDSSRPVTGREAHRPNLVSE